MSKKEFLVRSSWPKTKRWGIGEKSERRGWSDDTDEISSNDYWRYKYYW